MDAGPADISTSTKRWPAPLESGRGLENPVLPRAGVAAVFDAPLQPSCGRPRPTVMEFRSPAPQLGTAGGLNTPPSLHHGYHHQLELWWINDSGS